MTRRSLAIASLAGIALALPASRGAAQQALANCKIVAQEQGLEGKALKASIKRCFSQQRPTDSAIDHCRKAGRAKGIGDKALPTYVRSCVYGHG